MSATTSQYFKNFSKARNIVEGALEDAVAGTVRKGTKTSIDPIVKFLRTGFFNYANKRSSDTTVTTKDLVDALERELDDARAFIDGAQRALDSRKALLQTQ